MDWRNAKILFASTVTMVVATKIVKKVYKYFFDSSKTSQHESSSDNTCREVLSIRNREIYDVILFSDDLVRHTIIVPPNKEITVCESRELNCFKLIKYIKSARETLDVCMYLITSPEIAEQVIRLGQNHVIVRIVVDNEMASTPPSQIKKLQEYSFIQVQTNKKIKVMHHKFCIIDGPKAIKRKNELKAQAEMLNAHAQFSKNFKRIPAPKNKAVTSIVMSGSLNWSTQAMTSNHDNVVVTSHPNIVGRFENEFQSLWVENESVNPSFQRPELRGINDDDIMMIIQ